jgi:hypothetical protein
VVWAIIAAAIGYIVYYYDNYGKRSLAKRLTYGEVQAYGAIGYVILALGLIEWCVIPSSEPQLHILLINIVPTGSSTALPSASSPPASTSTAKLAVQ